MSAEKFNTGTREENEKSTLSREEVVRQTAELLRAVAEGMSGKITSAEEALQEHAARRNADRAALPEKITSLAQEVLVSDLAYQDAAASEEIKNRRLEWVKSSENAGLYANAIAELAHEPGQSIEVVRDNARDLVTEVVAVATRLGIPVSPETRSLSWAMWDTGKQYAYYETWKFGHHGGRDTYTYPYQAENPLTSEHKRKEMANRQLGWEAYKQYRFENSQWKTSLMKLRSEQEKKDDWLKVTQIDVILMLLNQPPKTNGTLSSYHLAQLGSVVRMLDRRK